MQQSTGNGAEGWRKVAFGVIFFVFFGGVYVYGLFMTQDQSEPLEPQGEAVSAVDVLERSDQSILIEEDGERHVLGILPDDQEGGPEYTPLRETSRDT